MNDETVESDVIARRGFFPIVRGNEVTVQQAGGRIFLSRGKLSLTQGGGQIVLGAGDVSVQQGGAQLMIAGGDVTVTQGGAMAVAARDVHFRDSYVGVAFGRHLELNDSKVVIGREQALALGAAMGLVLALVLRLFRRS